MTILMRGVFGSASLTGHVTGRTGQTWVAWDGTVDSRKSAGQALDGVICMALSSKPRYAVFMFDIKMYGFVSMFRIFDNCRLAITRGLRWMDGRMEMDGWRWMDGEGWMDESRDG